MLANQILILIVLLILSGFFSSAETALFSISKAKAIHMAKQKGRINALILKMKEGATRVEHGAAGHTDGPHHPAGDVRPGKGGPPLHDPVQVGCLDGCAQGTNGVKALIVGEKDDDIGSAAHTCVILRWCV